MKCLESPHVRVLKAGRAHTQIKVEHNPGQEVASHVKDYRTRRNGVNHKLAWYECLDTWFGVVHLSGKHHNYVLRVCCCTQLKPFILAVARTCFVTCSCTLINTLSRFRWCCCFISFTQVYERCWAAMREASTCPPPVIKHLHYVFVIWIMSFECRGSCQSFCSSLVTWTAGWDGGGQWWRTLRCSWRVHNSQLHRWVLSAGIWTSWSQTITAKTRRLLNGQDEGC